MTHVSREIVERLVAAAVSGHPEDMAGCYADQVVIEMPFTAGLYPARIETTRDELRQLAANSIIASFLPEAEKASWLAQINTFA